MNKLFEAVDNCKAFTLDEAMVTDYIDSDRLGEIIVNNPILSTYKDCIPMEGMILKMVGELGDQLYKVVKNDDGKFEAYMIDNTGRQLGDPFVLDESAKLNESNGFDGAESFDELREILDNQYESGSIDDDKYNEIEEIISHEETACEKYIEDRSAVTNTDYKDEIALTDQYISQAIEKISKLNESAMSDLDLLINDIINFFHDWDPYSVDMMDDELNYQSVAQALSNADEEIKLVNDIKEIANELDDGDELKNRANDLTNRIQVNESDDNVLDGDELRRKYFGDNLEVWSQPDEVIREINSKNFLTAKNFNQVLYDYENNPDSDWYIEVIKRAQGRIAERKERKELANQEKAQQDKIAREEREYKQAKRKLASLRKDHSTDIYLIDRLYQQIKDYETTHNVTEDDEPKNPNLMSFEDFKNEVDYYSDGRITDEDEIRQLYNEYYIARDGQVDLAQLISDWLSI